MSAFTELWAAQAELARDPEDLGAWHAVASGLCAAGDPQAGARALAELATAAAHAGHLPLALVAAKELEPIVPAVAGELVLELARMYGQGSKLLDAAARPRPPKLPEGGGAPPEPAPAEVLEEARKHVVTAAARARRERTRTPAPVYPLFAALAEAPFQELVRVMRPRRLRRGEVVIEQGQPGRSIFVVARGVVRIARAPADGAAERTLAYLRAGAFFGEMALLCDAPRSAMAVCESDVVAFEVDRQDLEALATKHPALAAVLAEHGKRRLLDNLIATSPLFRLVSPIERPALVERFHGRACTAGEVLLEEGKVSDGLFLLVSGRAAVEKREGSERLRLAELGPGDVFGEISLLRSVSATATVTAESSGMLLVLARSEFEAVAKAHPELVGAVYALVTERERGQAEALAADATAADDFLV
jgi:CRP-like cAMP-binding protein